MTEVTSVDGFSVSPGNPAPLVQGKFGYPGVTAHAVGDSGVPGQTVVVTLPPGKGLEFANNFLGVKDSQGMDKPFAGTLARDKQTLTVEGVDLALSKKDSNSFVYVTVQARPDAQPGNTNLTIQIGNQPSTAPIQIETGVKPTTQTGAPKPTTQTGTVWSWGDDDYGVLGNGGPSGDQYTPVSVRLSKDGESLTEVIQIACSPFHCLALMKDATVRAWGSNGGGQLGDGTQEQQNTPVSVKSSKDGEVLTDVVQIAAGGRYPHSLARMEDGTMRAWGWNKYGQLGTGDTNNRSTPVRVKAKQAKSGELSDLTGIMWIAAGITDSGSYVDNMGSSSFAVDTHGTVWAWGVNKFGQLGNNTKDDQRMPVQVKRSAGDEEPLTGVVQIAAGGNHALALMNDSTVRAWGRGENGEIGNGAKTNQTAPVRVRKSKDGPLLDGVTQIAAGVNSSYALVDGTVWAWGLNNHGQLGDGYTTDRDTPVQVKRSKDGEPLISVTRIAAGAEHVLALMEDGSVWAWGNGNWGRLGSGSGEGKDQYSPVRVRSKAGDRFSGVTQIAGGARFSLALKS